MRLPARRLHAPDGQTSRRSAVRCWHVSPAPGYLRRVRRQHTHQLIVREVPRLNSHDDANRMMFYPRVAKLGFIRHRGKKLLRVIRIIASDLRTQFDFATALLDELAHLWLAIFASSSTRLSIKSASLCSTGKRWSISPRPVGVIERVSFCSAASISASVCGGYSLMS